MKTLRVALNFNRLADGDLSAFTNNVINSMTATSTFSKPPVPLADVGKLLAAFEKAVAAAIDGGSAQTAAKNAAREALLAALRKLAAFVQMTADQDEALLRTSGFVPVSTTSRTPTKLSTPAIVAVDNEGTTKLSVRLKPVANARSYEIKALNGATMPAASVISTQARRIIIGNLTPGTTYTLQARAIGGADGYSEWSDPVSHMAI